MTERPESPVSIVLGQPPMLNPLPMDYAKSESSESSSSFVNPSASEEENVVFDGKLAEKPGSIGNSSHRGRNPMEDPDFNLKRRNLIYTPERWMRKSNIKAGSIVLKQVVNLDKGEDDWVKVSPDLIYDATQCTTEQVVSFYSRGYLTETMMRDLATETQLAGTYSAPLYSPSVSVEDLKKNYGIIAKASSIDDRHAMHYAMAKFYFVKVKAAIKLKGFGCPILIQKKINKLLDHDAVHCAASSQTAAEATVKVLKQLNYCIHHQKFQSIPQTISNYNHVVGIAYHAPTHKSISNFIDKTTDIRQKWSSVDIQQANVQVRLALERTYPVMPPGESTSKGWKLADLSKSSYASAAAKGAEAAALATAGVKAGLEKAKSFVENTKKDKAKLEKAGLGWTDLLKSKVSKWWRRPQTKKEKKDETREGSTFFGKVKQFVKGRTVKPVQNTYAFLSRGIPMLWATFVTGSIHDEELEGKPSWWYAPLVGVAAVGGSIYVSVATFFGKSFN